MAISQPVIKPRFGDAPGALWRAAESASAPQGSAESSRPARISDAVLVQACLDGDEAAWQKLVERYGPLVYSIPRRLGIGAEDADDVFQNVFLVAFRRLKTLKKYDSLGAWLIRITHRECLQFFKHASPDTQLADEILDVAALLPDAAEDWESRALVREALNQLDPRSRELLQALFFEVVTPSYEEIAVRLGVALGAVGPTRARCLKKLENILMSMGVDFSGT